MRGRGGSDIWGSHQPESPTLKLLLLPKQSNQSSLASHRRFNVCTYEAKREGSRVANVVTVVAPAVAIKSVKSGIYEEGQEQRGGGAHRGEQMRVMWCKVNRPTKVHLLRFSGTV